MEVVTVVRSAVLSDRPPLLLVHGAANSAAVWRSWQEELARRGWSTYAVDLRGHRKSSAPVDGASMSDYVDDVAAVAKELSEVPVVIGVEQCHSVLDTTSLPSKDLIERIIHSRGTRSDGVRRKGVE